MPSCKEIFLRPIECIPAVLLGLLLNLLDAISYGMISFPVNTVIFADFGPPGISMFFVSCIVAQLVYSLGGSAFDGGNGRAERIIDSVGEDKANVVIASTMVAFALSSMMTGVAFFLLGTLKLGSLIEFFPRHILVATIGGVGWFLVATGIEVSGRLDGNLEYNLPMLRALFLDGHTFALWFSAFMVAIALRVIQHYVRSSMVVPLFFMVLPLVFYAVVLIAGLSVDDVRDSGWIFPLVDDSVPFWQFYTYYDFTIVDWKAVAETIPAMLALTFFGLLHVPLNVPALSVSTNRDNVDLNRELVAHGISNTLSGCFGSVQNYLVYTNSLLFIRSGGDSRLAGLMLAGATAVIWMMGPWIVGYIPVMVVGSLIFHLGLDLLKEALIDTWNSVNNLEYITICVIVCTMATLGFVEGIFIGILTACLFFVVQNAHRSQTIRATYSGQIMRSTVRRLYRQQLFLNQVGKQIQVIKLQGYLFFGTINQVERAIREMLSTKDGDPIRFLILDLQLVQGLDFSAAEAFVRIRRLLLARQVFMIICNVGANSDEQRALKKAGVWDDKMMQQPSPLPSAWLVADNGTSNASSQIPGTQQQHIMEYNILRCFERLDDALEWCENVLLRSYFLKKPQHPIPKTASISMSPSSTVVDMQMFMASPRHQMLSHAVQHTVQDTPEANKAYANLTQPTLILLKSLGELANVNKTTHGDAVPLEFFHQLGRYFERWTCDKGQAIWRQGDVCEFLIVVEQGSLRSLMEVNKREHVVVESILPGTIVGELGLFTSTHSHDQKRTRSLIADQQSVFWKLTRSTFEQMVRDDPLMANQFVRLTLYYSVERQENMVQYAFHLHQ
ncbi:sulfate transporter family-domain-containing protein [Gongronella butleri]|nr:sulfate transporter family-domain-containing protein [Gongronella butleri]